MQNVGNGRFQILAIAFVVLSCGLVLARQSDRARLETMTFGNDKLNLDIAGTGCKFMKLVITGSGEVSPFHALGHFLALDGFGAPSAEEKALGMPFHGEADHQEFQIISGNKSGAVATIAFEATLPLAQETLTRTIQMVDNENVVYVSSELTSGLSIDRPISWAEHATLGVPFLEGGQLRVDLSATNCRVRDRKSTPIPGRLIPLRDFRWPNAPGVDGRPVDLRLVPTHVVALDLAACEMDPARPLAYVTALQFKDRLLFGYVFRREDYPWLMSWMSYTGDSRAARGMEFSTQPFDVSHRETVDMGPLFGIPTFRWLPGKAKITTRFLMFYVAVPEGFREVDDIKLVNGLLTVEDHVSGKQLTLRTSLSL
jgi:hypothetical protein